MSGFSDEEIEIMLDGCLEELEGSGRDFVESLREFFDERGFLTEKQQAALEKFYNNLDSVS